MGNDQLTGQQPSQLSQLSSTQAGNLSENRTTESRTNIDSPPVVASSGVVAASSHYQQPQAEGLTPQGTSTVSSPVPAPYVMTQTQSPGPGGAFNMVELNR